MELDYSLFIPFVKIVIKFIEALGLSTSTFLGNVTGGAPSNLFEM